MPAVSGLRNSADVEREIVGQGLGEQPSIDRVEGLDDAGIEVCPRLCVDLGQRAVLIPGRLVGPLVGERVPDRPGR